MCRIYNYTYFRHIQIKEKEKINALESFLSLTRVIKNALIIFQPQRLRWKTSVKIKTLFARTCISQMTFTCNIGIEILQRELNYPFHNRSLTIAWDFGYQIRKCSSKFSYSISLVSLPSLFWLRPLRLLIFSINLWCKFCIKCEQ